MLIIHHLDGSSGAVAGTVAAADAVGEYHAIALHPHRMTYMDGGLLFFGDGLDGTSGAYLAAFCAFGTAIPGLIR